MGPLVAPFHERTDGGGGGVEDADGVLLDDVPEAAFVGPVGAAFVHDDGCSVGEGAVDDVGVAGDPTDVGGTPVGVVWFEVEDPPRRHGGAEDVAGAGVEDAFGFAGGAGGVEDEQRVFAVEAFGWAVGLGWWAGLGAVHQFVVPVVAVGCPIDVAAGASDDDDFFDGRRTVVGERGVDVGFEGDLFAASPAAVGGDDEFGLGVVVAVGDGVC